MFVFECAHEVRCKRGTDILKTILLQRSALLSHQLDSVNLSVCKCEERQSDDNSGLDLK